MGFVRGWGDGARYRQNFLVIPVIGAGRLTSHSPLSRDYAVGSPPDFSVFRNFRRNFRRRCLTRSRDFLRFSFFYLDYYTLPSSV